MGQWVGENIQNPLPDDNLFVNAGMYVHYIARRFWRPFQAVRGFPVLAHATPARAEARGRRPALGTNSPAAEGDAAPLRGSAARPIQRGRGARSSVEQALDAGHSGR